MPRAWEAKDPEVGSALKADSRRRGNGEKVRAKKAKPERLDQTAIFEFANPSDVPPHIVWLCRKYNVTPQEVLHEFMRSVEMEPHLRLRAAELLMKQMQPILGDELGAKQFTVTINYVPPEH